MGNELESENLQLILRIFLKDKTMKQVKSEVKILFLGYRRTESLHLPAE